MACDARFSCMQFYGFLLLWNTRSSRFISEICVPVRIMFECMAKQKKNGEAKKRRHLGWLQMWDQTLIAWITLLVIYVSHLTQRYTLFSASVRTVYRLYVHGKAEEWKSKKEKLTRNNIQIYNHRKKNCVIRQQMPSGSTLVSILKSRIFFIFTGIVSCCRHRCCSVQFT